LHNRIIKNVLYVGNLLGRHGFTPGVIETLGPLLEEEGYHVYYAGTSRKKVIRLIEIILKVTFLGKKANYILIDTYSTTAFWFAYFAAIVARGIRVPYVPILHGGDLPRRLTNSKRASKSLFNNSYVNVAVSSYLKHEFEARGFNVVLIPNSIEISKYQFRLRNTCRPRLLWVRSFHRQYNPIMAADVLKELLKIYPQSELCMVGPDKDGSMEEFRNYVNTLGISEHVKITGLLKKEEWIKRAEDYDFFINTTNVDNTPVSVIEAMALGICVLSTNPGGIPFIIQDKINGILIEPGDFSNMAGELKKLIRNHELYKKLVMQGRSSAEKYSWESIKSLWQDLLS